MAKFTRRRVKKILKLAKGCTDNPVRKNFKPDAQELLNRLAVHLLYAAADDTYVILAANEEQSVYLEAMLPPEMEDEENADGTTTPRPPGTVEYMVCDGLPGHRTHGSSHYTLAEAMAEFREIAELGWGGWQQKHKPKKETA